MARKPAAKPAAPAAGKDTPLRGFETILGAVETKSVEAEYPALKSQSTRQIVDEFNTLYTYGGGDSDFRVIEPLYSPNALNRYAMSSGILRTCIDAMVTNIDGFGFTLEYIGEEGQQESEEAQAEHARVMGLLDHPNGEYSLIDLRRRFRADKESTGYGTIEVVRNPDDGFPDILYHVPSHTIRMTTQDREAVDAFRYMPRPGSDDNNMMQVRTRFRRYVQMVNNHAVYFREAGDLRPISSKDGRAMGGAVQSEELASDIILDAHYAPGSHYGAPRWIGDLRSVLGIQESENTNLSYFKDNGIPAMLLLVMGGAMTTEAQRDFKNIVQQSRGSGMQQKIVMIEVKGDEQAASDKGQIQRPEVRLEPLMQVRQSDAFFQEYEGNSSKKVRSSFRLPAMFTGLTEEVTYAVAQASLTIAESQVFGPERAQTDDLLNYHVLTYAGMPMRYWRFKSNPPRIQDSVEIMNALSVLERVGAMTPNIAIELANQLFDMRIPLIEEEWGNMPFTLTVAEMVDPVTGAMNAPSTAQPMDPEVGDGALPPPPNTDQTAPPPPPPPVRKRHRVRAATVLAVGETARKRTRTRKRIEAGTEEEAAVMEHDHRGAAKPPQRHRDAKRVRGLKTMDARYTGLSVAEVERAAPAVPGSMQRDHKATKLEEVQADGEGDE